MSLMQSLKKSPALFRHRLCRNRTELLSHGDPLFKVHYLGMETIYSLDPQQAEEAIGRLLDGVPGGRGKEHALVVRPRYVEVKELSTGRQLAKTFLQDIACCGADAAHPNVFHYICKQRGRQLQCRVFWCSRAQRARELTACLGAAFQRALSDRQGADGAQPQREGGGGNGLSVPPALPAYLGKGNSLEEAEPGLSRSTESDTEEGNPH